MHNLRGILAARNIDHGKALADADVRSRQAHALGHVHGLEHVRQELVQFRRVELGHVGGLGFAATYNDLQTSKDANETAAEFFRAKGLRIVASIDPTNGLVPGDRHVRLAWGRDYEDVSPLKGVILGGGAPAVRGSWSRGRPRASSRTSPAR